MSRRPGRFKEGGARRPLGRFRVDEVPYGLRVLPEDEARIRCRDALDEIAVEAESVVVTCPVCGRGYVRRRVLILHELPAEDEH